jgi:hypothetical protein
MIINEDKSFSNYFLKFFELILNFIHVLKWEYENHPPTRNKLGKYTKLTQTIPLHHSHAFRKKIFFFRKWVSFLTFFHLHAETMALYVDETELALLQNQSLDFRFTAGAQPAHSNVP